MEMTGRKILLLADAYSVHTYKWARSLAGKGCIVCIFSLNREEINIYKDEPGIRVIFHKIPGKTIQKNNYLLKLSYFRAVRHIKGIIDSFGPNIIHAHYATSYGILGALCKFHPFYVSVWGSDVFDFPRRSFLHRAVLKYTFRKADMIFSTSKIMAKETEKYTVKDIQLMPFGIDTDFFRPQEVNSLFRPDDIVIGTIKRLEDTYGVDYLIRSFKILHESHPQLPLKLLIVGEGSEKLKLEKLTGDLGIASMVKFTGHIDYEGLPVYHNMITIFGALSLRESFGVAVLESSACGKPVVVTDVGGLPEVVIANKTGILVPPRDAGSAFRAFEKLVMDENLRSEMGKEGRINVERNFNWEVSVDKMINLYNLS